MSPSSTNILSVQSSEQCQGSPTFVLPTLLPNLPSLLWNWQPVKNEVRRHYLPPLSLFRFHTRASHYRSWSLRRRIYFQSQSWADCQCCITTVSCIMHSLDDSSSLWSLGPLSNGPCPNFIRPASEIPNQLVYNQTIWLGGWQWTWSVSPPNLSNQLA